MLVDHADAVPDGVLRVADGRFRAVDQDLSLVGMVQAVEHLHQRRLARAILPQQSVDLAGFDIEVDFVGRQDAGKALDDADHIQFVDGLVPGRQQVVGHRF